MCICAQIHLLYASICPHSALKYNVHMCVLYINVSLYVCPCQPLTAMPESSQTPRRQRPDYLADFTSGSSTDNSCSSLDEEEEERRKAGGGGRGGEKREKKVSYDLGESKEKNLAERSGKKIWRWTFFPAVFLFYLGSCLLCTLSSIRSAWHDFLSFWSFLFLSFSMSTLYFFFPTKHDRTTGHTCYFSLQIFQCQCLLSSSGQILCRNLLSLFVSLQLWMYMMMQ